MECTCFGYEKHGPWWSGWGPSSLLSTDHPCRPLPYPLFPPIPCLVKLSLFPFLQWKWGKPWFKKIKKFIKSRKEIGIPCFERIRTLSVIFWKICKFNIKTSEARVFHVIYRNFYMATGSRRIFCSLQGAVSVDLQVPYDVCNPLALYKPMVFDSPWRFAACWLGLAGGASSVWSRWTWVLVGAFNG